MKRLSIQDIEKEDEEQLNYIDEIGNFNQFKTKNCEGNLFTEIKAKHLNNLLTYLNSNPDIKNLSVFAKRGINKTACLLAGNNTLTQLYLHCNNDILDQGFAYLADNKTLTSLTLDTKIGTRVGISALLKNTVLTELTLEDEVSSSVEQGDEIARILSSHPTLTKLKFFHCEMSIEGISSLLNNRVLRIFEIVNLSTNPMNSIIEILSTHSTITELTLTNCPINAEKVALFLKNKILKKLTLRDYGNLGDECARILSGHPTLTSLSLMDHKLTNKGIAFFKENNTLTHFSYNCGNYIHNNNINGESARVFSDHPTITDLELTGCSISSKGIQFFRKNKIIKKMILNRIPIEDKGACILSTLPLTSLGLENCHVYRKGVIALAGNPHLTDLSFGPHDCEAFGLLGISALAFSETLTNLSLGDSRIPFLGWLFLLGNQTLLNLKCREYDDNKDITEFSRQLGIRNSQFRRKYNAAVQKNLSKLMPRALVKVIQNYSKGEYPYRSQLFKTLHLKYSENGNTETIKLSDQLRIRNSQFQKEYDEVVQKNLSKLTSRKLANVIQDYSKGEYPYRHQLFNTLPPATKNKIKLELTELAKELKGVVKIR